jgi:Dolichyl-phosphate-mannose-protein mannosyltransferase
VSTTVASRSRSFLSGGARVRNRWPVALVGGLVVALGALHVWWLIRFRDGYPLDIDESGYLWAAFHGHDALDSGGLSRLWHAFQREGWVGPLLPTVTAVLELAGGDGQIVPSIAVQLLFFAVLVAASYGIGSSLLDRRAGLLTAGAVATLPAVTDFVRTYHLVMPSSAMYAAATYALLASDRLRRRRWAIVWGAALGLMLVSRAMIVAFVPALPVAAVWILVVDRARRRRVANFLLGVAAFVGVASLWYATSWRQIYDYLSSFGYGDNSPDRAPRLGVFTIGFWRDEVTGAVDLDFYLPLACVLAATLVVAAASAYAGRGRCPWRSQVQARARAIAASDAVIPGFVVLEGYLALSSSSNDGTGFVVPILSSFVALVVVAALRVRWRWARALLVAALVVISVFNVVMKADAVSGISAYRRVDVPGLGNVTVTSGRGFFQQYLVIDAGYTPESPTRTLGNGERGWLPVFDAVVAPLKRLNRPEGRLYLATSEPLLNPSSVRLAAIRSGQRGGVFEPLDTRGVDTVRAYRRALKTVDPDLLVTVSHQSWRYGPAVSQRLVEEAAVAGGLRRVRRLRAPDGREIFLWAGTRLQPPVSS